MKKLIILLIFCSNNLFSQKIEFGPLINLEITTFTTPDNSFIWVGPNGGGQGSRSTGFDSNLALGAYFSYFRHADEILSAEFLSQKLRPLN